MEQNDFFSGGDVLSAFDHGNQGSPSTPPSIDHPSLKTRNVGIDVLRLLSFIAIFFFHFLWFFWPTPPKPFPTPFFLAMELYARLGVCSGFALVFLTAFLFGGKAKIFSPRLLISLLFGWVGFSLVLSLKERTPFALHWDVYPLLLISLGLGEWGMKSPRRLALLAAGSVILLSLPVPTETRQLPGFLQEALFGLCPEDYADWPVFPWIGLVLLGLFLGKWVKQHSGIGFHFRPWEIPLGVGILLLYLKHSDGYFHTPLGDAWACFVYRRPPLVFWSHFLLLLYTLRLVFHPKIAKLLSHYLSFVSNLAILRAFHFAYFFHYVYTFLLSTLFTGLAIPKAGATLDLALLSVLLVTELATRVYLRSMRLLSLE